MNRLLIGLLLVLTAPLCAQADRAIAMEEQTNKIVAPQIAALNRTDIQTLLGCAPARPLLTMG
jgi:hypothetical protein